MESALRTLEPTLARYGIAQLVVRAKYQRGSQCVAGDMEQRCEIIFEEQFGGRWRDEQSWPPNRGIEVFQEWFECRLYSMVLDLDDESL